MVTPYYQDAYTTLYLSDYRDALSVYAPDAFDHVFTDFPYDEYTHANAKRNGAIKHDGVHDVYKLVDFQSWTADELRDHCATLAPFVKNWLISFVDWRHVLPIEQEPPTGLKFIRFGVWAKPDPVPQITGDRPSQGWEAIAMLHRDRPGKMTWNGGGHCASYNYPVARGDNRVSEHKTAKPLNFIIKLLQQFTIPGECIFDPCMGGGTTAVAARRLNRRFVGCELEERWLEAAARACEKEAGYTHTFDRIKAKQTRLMMPESAGVL